MPSSRSVASTTEPEPHAGGPREELLVLWAHPDHGLEEAVRVDGVRRGLAIRRASTAAVALHLASLRCCDAAFLGSTLDGSGSAVGLAARLKALQPGLAVVVERDPANSDVCRVQQDEAWDAWVHAGIDPAELCALIVAVARRSVRRIAGTLDWGPIHVDLLGGMAEVEGRELSLQPLQIRVLGYLVKHAGRVVSHEELRTQVFRVAQAAGSTSIARQISALRAALGPAAHLLVTARGGYSITGFGGGAFSEPAFPLEGGISCPPPAGPGAGEHPGPGAALDHPRMG